MICDRRHQALSAFLLRILSVSAVLAALADRDADAQSPGPVRADSAAACGEAAGTSSRRSVRVCRAGGAIEIDGIIDETAWRGATRVELPFEVYPGNNAAAPVATRCYLTFDDDYLLVACEAEDPDPNGIRAFFTPRDEAAGQDRIGVLLDPFNDARRAFEFSVTPLGVQGDGVYQQQVGSVDVSWDAIWRSAGRITDTGYTIELAIPFKSLRFPATSDAQTWGFHIWRVRPRSANLETRSVPFDRNNDCLLCQAGLLEGLQNISPGRNIQLTPSLTASRSDARMGPSADLASGPVRGRASLDAQWSPAPNVSVAATANPDFSQVEADVAVLDVNNRFTLQFPEKRPFFLEGAELYNTPLQLVFTRTISNPLFGARMTGKLGATALGLIVAGDRVNNLLLPANQGSSAASLDSDVQSTIVRARQDVGASSTVGVLYTGREGSGYHNRLVGVDGFVQPTPSVTMRLQLARSHTDYDDTFATATGQPAGGFPGTAVLAQANYQSRTWRGQALGRLVDRGFRADAGFVPQADVREINWWAQRQFWGGQRRWLQRLNLTAGHWTRWRSDDLMTERVFWGNVLYLGPGLLSVFLDFQNRREFYQGTQYSLNRYRADLSIAPTRSLSATLEARTGGAIDLANARAAHQVQVAASIRYRLGRHADLDLRHAFERLWRDGLTVVEAHLPQVRAVYNASARLYFRGIIQYRLTDRDAAAYAGPVPEQQKSLLSQLLVAYEVSPQTLVFLGYSEGRAGAVESDGSVLPVTLALRTFFVKLSYAWRL